MGNELVIINKYNIIERCIKRIKEIYQNNPANLQNYDKQEAIMLNLQRACQAGMDIGRYIISVSNLENPQFKKDTFEILAENKIITEKIEKQMKYMSDIRNKIIYEYQEIDLKIIQSIIENNLTDLQEFAREMISKI